MGRHDDALPLHTIEAREIGMSPCGETTATDLSNKTMLKEIAYRLEFAKAV